MAIRSFNETSQLENEYNQASNKEIINGWHQRNNTNRYYIIDDKQNHKLGGHHNGEEAGLGSFGDMLHPVVFCGRIWPVHTISTIRGDRLQ